MGGKKKTGSGAGKAPKVEVDPEAAQKARETKAEGDKLFVSKEFAKAFEAYASAAGMLPDGAAERADLLSAKAACLYAQRRWRDSARECSAALAVPGAGAAGAKALLRRAHCYEHLALFKQALSDAQAYNRTELATEDSKRLEQRLRAAMQGGGGPSLARAANGGGANGGSATAAQAAAARAYQQQQQQLLKQQQQQQQAQQQQQRPPAPTFLAAKCILQRSSGDAVSSAADAAAEARLVQMPVQAASYASLRAAVVDKFGSLLAGKHFLLKYADGAGAPVTITCREDVAQATSALLEGNPSAVRRLALSGGVAPPFDVTVVPVEDSGEVPPVPEEEEKARVLFERHTRAMLARELQQQAMLEAQLDKEEEAQRQQRQQQQDEQQQEQGVHVDDWVLQFAELFREVSLIDPDAHHDALNDGWDATTRAMKATLRCDAALPLFVKAQDKFAEVTALGLTNWGNVHVNMATKQVEDASPAAAEAARAAGLADTNDARAKVAKPAMAAAAKKAAAELDAAEKRYQEALKYKPDFFDALAAMGQLEFERAKLRAGLAPVTTAAAAAEKDEAADADPAPAAAEAGGEDAEQKGRAAEVTPAAADALREALRRVAPGDVSAAKKHYDAAAKWFEKARQSGAASDAKRVAEAGEAARRGADAEAEGGAAEGGAAAAAAAAEAEAQQLSPDLSTEAQALIMAGNVAYEWSQLLAAVAGDEGRGADAAAGKAWRAALDDAAAKFREAKCSESDVRAALKNHTRAADLDLGSDPEEEEEKEEEAGKKAEEDGKAKAAPAAAEAKPAAKGLPSLEVKGKKKAEAATATKA